MVHPPPRPVPPPSHSDSLGPFYVKDDVSHPTKKRADGSPTVSIRELPVGCRLRVDDDDDDDGTRGGGRSGAEGRVAAAAAAANDAANESTKDATANDEATTNDDAATTTVVAATNDDGANDGTTNDATTIDATANVGGATDDDDGARDPRPPKDDGGRDEATTTGATTTTNDGTGDGTTNDAFANDGASGATTCDGTTTTGAATRGDGTNDGTANDATANDGATDDDGERRRRRPPVFFRRFAAADPAGRPVAWECLHCETREAKGGGDGGGGEMRKDGGAGGDAADADDGGDGGGADGGGGRIVVARRCPVKFLGTNASVNFQSLYNHARVHWGSSKPTASSSDPNKSSSSPRKKRKRKSRKKDGKRKRAKGATQGETTISEFVRTSITQEAEESKVTRIFGVTSLDGMRTVWETTTNTNTGAEITTRAARQDARVETELETTICPGLRYSAFTSVEFQPDYCFPTHYPFSIHAEKIQEQFKNYRGFKKPIWTVNVDGMIHSEKCKKVVLSEKEGDQKSCSACSRLMSHPHLIETLKRSSLQNYKTCSDALAPHSFVRKKKDALKADNQRMQLEGMANKRKIGRLSKRRDDASKFIDAVRKNQGAELQVVAGRHFRRGGSLKSLIPKLDEVVVESTAEEGIPGGEGWGADDDAMLTEIVRENKKPENDWNQIASRFVGRGDKSAKDCQERWERWLKPGSRRGRWTDEEDALISHVMLNDTPEDPAGGGRFGEIAARLPGRAAKQVRNRWTNHLNPAINKLPFTREEDLLVWEGHHVLGGKWTEISSRYFRGTRSDQQVNNRWHSAGFRKFVAAEFGEEAYERHRQEMNAGNDGGVDDIGNDIGNEMGNDIGNVRELWEAAAM